MFNILLFFAKREHSGNIRVKSYSYKTRLFALKIQICGSAAVRVIICVVRNTSPPLGFRECRSCFRDLSLGNFGLRRLNADSFNEVCKDCKNYRRKVSYYRRLEKLNRLDPTARDSALKHVFPLNEQNRKVLSKLSRNQSHEVSAEFIKTGKKSVVKVDFRPEHFRLVVPSSGDHPTAYQCFHSTVEGFTETILSILHDLRLRLD